MAKRIGLVAQRAWLGGDALESEVLLEIENGVFVTVLPDSGATDVPRLAGTAIPGLVNTHSHAFHRLLRGRSHRQGGDFWAWRELMYQIADQLTPESYEEIATAVFVEMALAGITMVGEFHYVHHGPGGSPYGDPNEMGHAVIRAARRAGIRISLLDAGYFRMGFAHAELGSAQRRFSDGSVGAWLDRVGALQETYDGDDDVRIGLAPHSVRAVPETGLAELAEQRRRDVPLHIHVSEQPAENEATLEATGATPVGLLNRSGLLGNHTTAVHATHLTPGDITMLGDTHTGVCYCPTTERDLGDGIGPGVTLYQAGSPLSVGSDSHAVIDLFEEMRGIELHARLRSGRRGLMSARDLLRAPTGNGARALGFDHGRVEVGRPADFVMIDGDSPRTAGNGEDAAGLVYSASAADVTDVYVGGERIVSSRHHPVWDTARRALHTYSPGV